MKAKSSFGPLRLVAAVLALSASTAHAVPILTQAGIDAGFTLSTFVSGLPGTSSGYEALGIAVNSDGNVIVNNSANATNYVFKNVDGQTTVNALSSTSFGAFPASFAVSGGTVYGSGSGFYKMNNNGSIAANYSALIPASYGMWTNPSNGHIIAISNSRGLIDIDVSGATPSYVVINSSAYGDGVTVSPDGTRAYTSSGYVVDLGSKAIIGNFSVAGADGMGIIASSNALNGKIIVNTTNGNIVMVDQTTFVQTIIASGGGYGDYTGADPTTGTLLLSSANAVVRLGCGQGCGIWSAPPPSGNVPEPTTVSLLAVALLGMTLTRRRSRK